MAAKLDYTWKLREVMATRGLFQTTQLRPRLAERGIRLSDSQVYLLVVDKPERLNLKVLMALLDILGCRMDDLIQPVAGSGCRAAPAARSVPSPPGFPRGPCAARAIARIRHRSGPAPAAGPPSTFTITDCASAAPAASTCSACCLPIRAVCTRTPRRSITCWPPATRPR